MGVISDFRNISKKLVEEIAGCAVLSYRVEEGSKLGDNYMSVLYSVSAELLIPPTLKNKEKEDDKPKKEVRHLLFKCYPKHPARQKYFNGTNMFHNEHCFYKIWVKCLQDFQEEYLNEEERLAPPFPPFIGGKTIDFSKMDKGIHGDYQPLDNFIVMTDLRKSDGFRMVDKTAGLDFDHLTLAITELAKVHALSWAYQQRKLDKDEDILDRFPFLKMNISQNDKEMWTAILLSNLQIAVEAIKLELGADSSLAEAVTNSAKNLFKIVKLFNEQEEKGERESWKWHRSPPPEMVEASAFEEPWRIICHGDSWSNNLLFKYNSTSGKPEKVVIFDFQLSRKACPTVDLSYLMYTATTVQFRQQHLNFLLKLYFERFNEFCKILKVEPFPGWSLNSLKTRFHQRKLIGYMMSLVAYPSLFKLPGDQVNLDNVDKNTDMEKMMADACKKGALQSKVYRHRIVQLAKELHEEGVI